LTSSPRLDLNRNVYRTAKARRPPSSGVEAFRYRSARDAAGGIGLELFTPRAFVARRPSTPRTWHCSATRQRVDFVRLDALDRARLGFARRLFLVGQELPQPAP
jgi:hypothetical protein